MISVQRILCPIDFSDFSRHALDHAVAMARWYGAEVVVLYVLPPVELPLPMPDLLMAPAAVATPDDLKEIEDAVERFVRTEVGDEVVTVAVRAGTVVDEIVCLAKEWLADLIVMGTHGRTGFERFLVGSVTARVLRNAPCPVVTVPKRMADAVSTGTPFRRILCGVDFSPSSMQALTIAAALAEEADATLTVVHVIEHQIFEPTAMPGLDSPREIARRDSALQQIRAALPRDVSTYADVHELVLTGKAYREILRHADDMRADLIVLGAGGGLVDAAFGSTADHVVKEAACPVLTVKPSGQLLRGTADNSARQHAHSS